MRVIHVLDSPLLMGMAYALQLSLYHLRYALVLLLLFLLLLAVIGQKLFNHILYQQCMHLSTGLLPRQIPRSVFSNEGIYGQCG